MTQRTPLERMPQYSVFRDGSKTYFNSSLFFPESVRRDVFILYGFVRIADNFVDSVPQDAKGFADFCSAWEQADCGSPSGDPIIDDYVELSRRRNFHRKWTQAFLASMAADLGTIAFDTLEDTLAYIYGSAEVIGLFMSRILELPEPALLHARLLGRAMQYINFLRDIAEDNTLGRRYLPLADSGLKDLSEAEARNHPERFRAWFHRQASLYRSWHREAARGYGYIPHRYLIPIRTAEDMYLWTAETLEKDPLEVYRRKVKPPKSRIRRRGILNAFMPVRRPSDNGPRPDLPGGILEPDLPDLPAEGYLQGSCEEQV